MSLASLLKEIQLKKRIVNTLKEENGKKYINRSDLLELETEIVQNERKRKHEASDDNKNEVDGVEQKKGDQSDDEDLKRQKILEEMNEYKRKLKEEELEELRSVVTKEDQALLDSINDDELESKLKEFGAEYILNESETRLERIKRLQKLELKRDLEIKKQEQIKLEAEIDYHIVLQDIKDDRPKVCVQLRAYIKYLLKEWEESLTEDDEQQKNLLTETKKSIVSLMVKLRHDSLPDDVFASLSTTMKYLQDKNYLMSNDSYLKLSIGNACWPIGVMNIGIHARSAHSRLTGQENKANIMSDEKTRRWLMSVKRLITFAEKKWPN